MIIRQLEEKDIEVCASIMAKNPLWQKYQVTFASASARFKKGFEENATILVADSQGIPVGFVWYVTKGAFSRSGYIMLIGVDPDALHQGTGRELMNAAEQIMFSHSDDVILLVSDFNLKAQAFYKHCGYAHIGSIPDYVIPSVAELIFRKHKS